jgi:F0F1-type ATP synthase membrane subunit b/b'
MQLTIGEIINILTIIAGTVGSIVTIHTVINKIVTKKINSQMNDILTPLKEYLEEIKKQNVELKEQGEDTKKEIILIMKLNQTMIDELKTKGHVNGRTSEALEELNDYLMNK